MAPDYSADLRDRNELRRRAAETEYDGSPWPAAEWSRLVEVSLPSGILRLGSQRLADDIEALEVAGFGRVGDVRYHLPGDPTLRERDDIVGPGRHWLIAYYWERGPQRLRVVYEVDKVLGAYQQYEIVQLAVAGPWEIAE